MPSVESILTRIAAVEAEKQLLRSQLSEVRRNASPERPPRRPTVNQDVPRESRAEKVTGWLNSPAPKSAHSPLLDFFINYERHLNIFDNIYCLLDIKDILAISQTCTKLSSFYHNMIPSKWNINRRLARFVNDPKEFRSRLGEADALISGTFALLFFAQLYWLDSGLDIYVRQGSKANALVKYIGEDPDYMFDYSYGWSDDDEHRTLTKVLIFRRKGPPASPQIRFHLTRTLPLHSILTDCAFSTAHVNIITWNKAYCMFPNVTFIDRRMYFLHNPDEALGQILSKYSAHGWRSSEWIDYDQIKGCTKFGIRENIRRVGDSSTWVIPLSLHHVRTPSTSDSIIESSTFQIYPDYGPQESQHAVVGLKTFSIGAQTFTCCMLKHAYTFHIPDPSWSRFLRDNLSRMVMLEILKTGDAELLSRTRQPDFMVGDHKCCPLLRALPRFRRPEGWECVDHMIPTWFAEWRKLRANGTDDIDLTPHPLSVVRSKKPPKQTLASLDLSSPPPLPPPRARSMTCRLPQKLPSSSVRQGIPTPPASSKSDHFPLSSRQAKSPPPRPPRTASIGNMQMMNTPTKIPAVKPPPRRELSSQLQTSKSESALAQRATQRPMPGTTRHQAPQPVKLPSPKKDYFSLRHRRPKALVPPPLDLKPTIRRHEPLIPDLLTPPPDVPLPALPTLHQNHIQFPMQLQHLPLSPFGKKFRGVITRSRASSSAYSGETALIEIPEHMNFI